jgi:hypothetical protein
MEEIKQIPVNLGPEIYTKKKKKKKKTATPAYVATTNSGMTVLKPKLVPQAISILQYVQPILHPLPYTVCSKSNHYTCTKL